MVLADSPEVKNIPGNESDVVLRIALTVLMLC